MATTTSSTVDLNGAAVSARRGCSRGELGALVGEPARWPLNAGHSWNWLADLVGLSLEPSHITGEENAGSSDR